MMISFEMDSIRMLIDEKDEDLSWKMTRIFHLNQREILLNFLWKILLTDIIFKIQRDRIITWIIQSLKKKKIEILHILFFSLSINIPKRISLVKSNTDIEDILSSYWCFFSVQIMLARLHAHHVETLLVRHSIVYRPMNNFAFHLICLLNSSDEDRRTEEWN